jgi:hypothetical protein
MAAIDELDAGGSRHAHVDDLARAILRSVSMGGQVPDQIADIVLDRWQLSTMLDLQVVLEDLEHVGLLDLQDMDLATGQQDLRLYR